jgi:peptidoglycan/LPS O-acetylase OafA/YrhL
MALSHPSTPSRIAFLESIRGLAAIQVVLLHAFSAFWPELASEDVTGGFGWHVHLSPLYFLYDGHTAVYIFFVLSGYVLSRSFESHLNRPLALIAARAVRLGLPALAAVLVSAALIAMLGRPNIEAGDVAGSEWLTRWRFTDMSAFSILRDGIANALFLGYRELSSVGFLSPWQQPFVQSFVPPLWTLSIEFYGSLLVLVLCLCARQTRPLWWAAVILMTLFTIRSAYASFVAGYLLASWHRAERPARQGPVLPIMAIAFGIFLCVRADVWQFQWIQTLCENSALGWLPGQSAARQQKMLGAICLLTGVIHLQWARSVLSWPAMVRLSRLSFPIYLVHWPILFGPAALIFLRLNDVVGLEPARLGAAVAGIGLSYAAALLFLPIDRQALALSRRWRERVAGIKTAPSLQRVAVDEAHA